MISDDGRLRYLGGRLPIAGGLARRATDLAERSFAALPACVGYAGVDMILGRDPSGSEDYVLDVNPRLTTSYLGLRQLADGSLAEGMIRMMTGEPWEVTFGDWPVEFLANGAAS